MRGAHRVGDLEKDPFEDMASRGKAYLYSTQVYMYRIMYKSTDREKWLR